MKQEPLRIALRNMREEVRQLRRVAMLDFAKRHNLTPGPIPQEHWIEFNELIQEYSILLHKRELEVRKWFNELR